MSFVLAAAVVAQAAAGPITLEISNVRNARGKVLVAVCTQPQFLKTDCTYNAGVQARAGTVSVTLPDIPAGTYAVQAFHDENNNENTDQNFIGIPKEGVGFSRDARISFGPPKWRDAQFVHQGRAEVLRFRLRYMIGPSGPPTARPK